MTGNSLRSLAIALTTAAVAVSIVAADGRAATIRKDTVTAELPLGQATDHAVGDRAVWMEKKRGKLTVVVTGIKGGVVSRRFSDGCSYDLPQGNWQAPATRWKDCSGSTGTAKVARKGKSRLYPLKVGNTSIFNVRGKSKRAGKVNSWSTTRRCEVTGTANVTVPAGRFDAYRIDCSDEWTRYRWYYSPELRHPVLIIQTPSSGDSDRGLHMEFVSHDPA